MKKILSFLLTVILFAVATLPTYAAETIYYVYDHNLVYSVSDEYDVFSRNIHKFDPLFKEYGTKLPTVADIEAVEPTETPQQPPRPEKVKVKAVKAKKTDKNK